jgi:hypothetical protein
MGDHHTRLFQLHAQRLVRVGLVHRVCSHRFFRKNLWRLPLPATGHDRPAIYDQVVRTSGGQPISAWGPAATPRAVTSG